jgi:succinyl-CoA synthetase beta subunit
VDLFEYQGKDFFVRYQVPTTRGRLAKSVQEAVEAAREIGFPAVVKAQVQVGGRGKAGGVRVVSDAGSAKEAAEAILALTIKGHKVHKLWVEPASDIDREYYLSLTLDRGSRDYLLMLSALGGMDIEEVAAEHPEAIVKVHIDPLKGIDMAKATDAVKEAQMSPTPELASLVLKLYDAFIRGDADLVEINPLALLRDGRVVALDAKVSLDDNASFRHPEWDLYRAELELDEREVLAKKHGLNYIGLEGSVGIIANGAGLAMATLDVVSQVGGEAANFLDLGGGASPDVMAAALEVIDSDDRVKSVLVNIFGGITRCDDVANGIVKAMERVSPQFPIVVRLDGTHAKEGREILADCDCPNLRMAETMVGAARLAVELAGGGVR